MRALLVGLALLLAGCSVPAAPPPPDPEPAPRPFVELGPWQGPAQPAPEAPAPPTPAPTPPAAEPDPEAKPEEPTTPPPPPSPPPAAPPGAPAPEPPPPPAAPAVPVQFERGADAAPSSTVRRLALAADGGAFDASIAGVDGATVRIGSLVRLANVDGTTHVVRLTAAPVDDPRVVAARFHAGGATLDLRSATPTLELSLTPGARLDVAFELTLAGASPGETLFVSRVETSLDDG